MAVDRAPCRRQSWAGGPPERVDPASDDHRRQHGRCPPPGDRGSAVAEPPL